jgi:hypothetical protein
MKREAITGFVQGALLSVFSKTARSRVRELAGKTMWAASLPA